MVYCVEDITRPGVTIALKEVPLPAEKIDFEESIAAFERERTILQALNHPGLPRLLDAFMEEDTCYLAMELIEGRTLQKILDQSGGILPFEALYPVAGQILEILDYLHSRAPPVIFRDLKPSNVMIAAEGAARLIDFGIARVFAPAKVKDTFVMGTPGFAAPEQYGTRQTDPRSDIYAFGTTMFYLLTGRYPEQFAFRFPEARSLNPDVPRWFSNILVRCLRRDPAARYPSARAVLDELSRPPGDRLGKRITRFFLERIHRGL
jgi:serine/threonine-protein kinase